MSQNTKFDQFFENNREMLLLAETEIASLQDKTEKRYAETKTGPVTAVLGGAICGVFGVVFAGVSMLKPQSQFAKAFSRTCFEGVVRPNKAMIQTDILFESRKRLKAQYKKDKGLAA